MLYCVGLRTPADQVALSFYVLCGLTRLARFNIAVSLVPKNALGRASYIEGLPTAYAALMISTTVTIYAQMDWLPQGQVPGSLFPDRRYDFRWATTLVVVLSAVMASKRLRFSFDGTWSIPIVTAGIFICCWRLSSV